MPESPNASAISYNQPLDKPNCWIALKKIITDHGLFRSVPRFPIHNRKMEYWSVGVEDFCFFCLTSS